MSDRGRIHIDLFTTLDGVAQSPGRPDEDPSGGFRFGGWQAPIFDDVIGAEVGAGIRRLDALVLGRRTYEVFAGYWPHHDGGASMIADKFNAVPKYVASRGEPALDWSGTTLLGGGPGADVVAEMDALRDRHREIHVIGSVDFARTLLDAGMFDELVLWVHPLVLGEGKRVFTEGATPATLRLLAPALTGPSGTVQLRYGPAGPVAVGDMDDVDV